jgi:FkbM family methyltransferase
MLVPILDERRYQAVQSVAMAWDICTGSWSEPELGVIRHAVRAGDTVLDIGANYGFWSYHLARAVGRGGKVYAFEPLPFTAGVFRTTARLLRFRNVQLFEMGCSDVAGRVTFTVPVQDNGALIAGLAHMERRDDSRPGHEPHEGVTAPRRVECEVVVLDSFLPQLGALEPGCLSFVKCDIEGAELFALRGAHRTIADHHPVVVCEINPGFLERFGLRVGDLVDFFADLGYGVYRYDRGRLWPTPAEEIVAGNWVFVHPRTLGRIGLSKGFAVIPSPLPSHSTASRASKV